MSCTRPDADKIIVMADQLCFMIVMEGKTKNTSHSRFGCKPDFSIVELHNFFTMR